MIVETTLRKAMFLLMGTWVVQSDRETSRKRRELRKWIIDSTAEQREENQVELLRAGGFSFSQSPDGAAYLPIEVDFTVDQLNMLPTMFQRGVLWPNLPEEEQEEELDELESDVEQWQEQEKAERMARTLSKKQKKVLAKEFTKETGETDE